MVDYNIEISIVVPCYQEEKHLRESVEAIYTLLNSTRYKFEMIFVEDCSKDKTKDVILAIVEDFPNTQYLFHEINVGRGGSFLDGVKMAKGKYIGFLDIDLEVSHIYLLSVIQSLESGNDIAIVRRHYAIAPSFIFIVRHLLSVGYKILIMKYLGIPKMDTETGFKFFRKDCIVEISKDIQNRKWFFDTEVMVLAYLNNYKIQEVHGLFMRKTEKTSTVKLFSDTIDYFREIYKFKRRLQVAKKTNTVP
jgi:glycosyltransferase involved in cell wall biosynthesis